jgi:aldose 1-epimerase
MCPSGRGQVLAPWPNRLEDGAYDFDGRHLQAPINEIEAHNAIHGLVRWEAWSVREHEPHRIVMEHELRAQPGYPFPLALSIEYALTDIGLTVRTTAENVGRAACPFGSGNHPYLTLGTPVDALTLHAPARTVLHADERGLPRSSAPVEGTEYDFRMPRSIGATVLDHCYTDLDRDERGLARVDLRDPDAGSGVTLWLDGSYHYVMLFTGDPLPDVARRALRSNP